METEKWKRARMIAFNARIGSHLDPRKLPESEEAFLPLVDKRSGLSKEAKEQLKREREEYERNQR